MKRTTALSTLPVICSTLLAPVANGAELPKRAAGLWEEKIASGSTPGAAQVHRICVDQKLMDLLKFQGTCSKQEVRAQAGGYVVEAVCKQGESSVRSRTVISGDLKQAYAAEMNASYDPPLGGIKESKLVVSARLLGACPAGMRGGDVVTSDGTKLNLHDADRGILPK